MTKRTWERPYKKGKIHENENQFQIFQIYEGLGVTRTMKELWEYQYSCDKIIYHPDVKFPCENTNNLHMARQI